MQMRLTFIGADHEVTGSCHFLEVGNTKVLIDCGMEQGNNIYQNAELPVGYHEIDYDENEPPVMALKKPNTSVVCFANQFAKNDVSIPGIGSWLPKRMTTSIMKV